MLTNWRNAQTILERAHRNGQGRGAPSDAAAADERLSDWTDSPPFDDPDILRRRLAAEGLDLTAFQTAVGSVTRVGRESAQTRPRWVDDFDLMMSAPTKGSEASASAGAGSFLGMVEPLVAEARRRAEMGLSGILPLPQDSALTPARVTCLFLPKLHQVLLERLSRVVVLEMHAARLRGELTAPTADARYREFMASLSARSRSILNKYPVLARALWTAAHNWVGMVMDFTRHLRADWDALEQRFNGGAPLGQLVELRDSGSDPHEGGCSVLILRFGTGRSIVYKPRSLAVDQHFQDLLAWVNASLGEGHFAIIEGLDRDDHGWARCVEHRDCDSEMDFPAYFERIGGYLAIFYLLGSTDIHFENLIADGPHPYVVDLETALHPDPGGLQKSPSANHRMYSESVMRIGLLPRWTRGEDERSHIDVSGLSDVRSGVWPEAIAQWRNLESDDMHIERAAARVVRSVRNLPTCGEHTAKAGDFIEEIKTGFRRIYDLLYEARADLLAPGGPIDAFASDETRVVLRSTRTYQALAQESFHPEVLGDGLERERFFDLLLWKEVRQAPFLATIIPAEKTQLWDGDIPRFTAAPGSRSLRAASGRWTFTNFFPATALEDIRGRAESMGPLDRELQCDFITGAFRGGPASTDQMPVTGAATRGSTDTTRAGRVRARALAAAKHVADQLAARAHCERGHVGWFGPTVFASGQVAIQPLHWQFYDGVPGVAMFLAYAGAEFGIPAYTSLARQAVDSLVARLPFYAPRIDSAGAFDGWCGSIYALTHVGTVWNDSPLLELCDELTGEVLRYRSANATDIISGHAGAIAALLALHEATGSTGSIEAAGAFGRRLADLLSDLTVADPSCGEDSPKFLTHFGFAHGFHGLIWSLLKLAHAAGDTEVTSKALATLAVCNSRMPLERGMNHSAAWCNGLGGIGLAWSDLAPLPRGEGLKAQRDLVLGAAQEAPPQSNHSLCHGETGTLEVIANAARTRGRPTSDHLLSRVEAVAGAVLTGSVVCGTHLGQINPGLMTGLSGVGWGLLRFAVPDGVPNILLLEGPKR